MAAKTLSGVLAAFKFEDSAIDAIKGLRARGYRDLTVYTAAHNHHIEEALEHKTSWVRAFTLIGGLIGLGAGFGLTLWMSYDWPLLRGGKPVGAIPPYVVICFEFKILSSFSRRSSPSRDVRSSPSSVTTPSVCLCRARRTSGTEFGSFWKKSVQTR